MFSANSGANKESPSLEELIFLTRKSLNKIYADYSSAYNAVSISFIYDNKIYITPKNCEIILLQDELAMSCTTLSGAPLNNIAASKHINLHTTIYRQRRDVFCIITARTPYASLLARTNNSCGKNGISSGIIGVDDKFARIPLVDASTFSAQSNGSIAYIFQNGEVLAGGRSFADALINLSITEESARAACAVKAISCKEFFKCLQ